MLDDTWLTVGDIVTHLRVHKETVRRWLRSGRLIGRNFGGKMGYRVRKSDLETFLADEQDASEATARE